MSREKIFAAALQVLAKEGTEGLSVRKVASVAGVSPMAMYRHFADKEALLNALMLQGFVAWEARVASIKAKDPVKWLDALTEVFLGFALEEPHLFDAAFFLPAPKARRYPDDFAAGRSPAVAMIASHIEAAQAAGELVAQPVLSLVLSIAAMGQGFVSMHRAGRFASEDEFKRLYRVGARQCLESMKAKPSKR